MHYEPGLKNMVLFFVKLKAFVNDRNICVIYNFAW
jgi:hypothetical protein